MDLLFAHQILIGAAILLSTLFGARAIFLLSRGQGRLNAVIAAASLAVAGALIVYLRTIRGRWIEQREVREHTRAAKASRRSPGS